MSVRGAGPRPLAQRPWAGARLRVDDRCAAAPGRVTSASSFTLSVTVGVDDRLHALGPTRSRRRPSPGGASGSVDPVQRLACQTSAKPSPPSRCRSAPSPSLTTGLTMAPPRAQPVPRKRRGQRGITDTVVNAVAGSRCSAEGHMPHSGSASLLSVRPRPREVVGHVPDLASRTDELLQGDARFPERVFGTLFLTRE